MLTEMQLKDAIEPFKQASCKKAHELCKKHIRHGDYVVHQDGTVDVHGDLNLDSFVVNGKLAVRFGDLTGGIEVLKLSSVRTLEGLPKSLLNRILDVRSGFLKDLTGSPEEADFMYVNSSSLTSFEGAPKQVHNTFSVIAPSLKTLRGLPNIVGTLDLSLCKSVKTTDGLAGVKLGSATLPAHLEEVTELPATCISIALNPCVGLAHVFRIPDLAYVKFSNPTGRESKTVQALNEIAEETLELSPDLPKVRWLHAERLLIDRDLEYLL